VTGALGLSERILRQMKTQVDAREYDALKDEGLALAPQFQDQSSKTATTKVVPKPHPKKQDFVFRDF
jgi:hypothetical protein